MVCFKILVKASHAGQAKVWGVGVISALHGFPESISWLYDEKG